MPTDDAPFEGRWAALVGIGVAIIIVALDITLVGIAAPALASGLGATSSQIQWTFDGYIVTFAGFLLIGGGLAERYGRKGVLQVGCAVFAAGSALSAFAPTVGIMILGRVISGLGAAAVFPPALSLTGVLFPPEERQRAFSVFASISAVGVALGPFIGGLLLEHFWYGSVFLAAVPVAIAAILAIGFLVPPSRRGGDEPLDWVGAVLSVLALGGIVFAIIEGPAQGWVSPVVLASLAVGLIGLALFVWWEGRVTLPLFDLGVLLDQRVASGGLALFTVYFTLGSIQLLVPQYLRYVSDVSSLHTGVLMLPVGIGLLVLSPLSGPLIERFGRRFMLTLSLLLMASGLGLFLLLDVWGGPPNVVLALSVFSAGFGLVVAPATATVMAAVPPEKVGDGSAVNMVSRQVGGAVGVAVIGSIASLVYARDLDLEGLGLTADQQAQVEQSLAGALSIESEIAQGVAQKLDLIADAAMTKGLSWGMATAGFVALVAGVLAAVALRESKT